MNKSVEHIEIECLECMLIDEWSCQDTIDQSRKAGALIKSGKCPHCSSTRGKIIGLSWPSAAYLDWLNRTDT